MRDNKQQGTPKHDERVEEEGKRVLSRRANISDTRRGGRRMAARKLSEPQQAATIRIFARTIPHARDVAGLPGRQ